MNIETSFIERRAAQLAQEQPPSAAQLVQALRPPRGLRRAMEQAEPSTRELIEALRR